ncbi:MAG TPA: hypothetical protein VHQ47_18875 [Phycisphaerae bacterium]|nr:hypothetical protein [Phycisphaerae bacterium]
MAEITRRDMLKVAASVGAAALATQVQAQASQPAKPSDKIVGMQLGAGPLAGDLDKLLDTMRNVAGLNALFVFIFGHEARFIPMPQRGFRGGNYAIPHMQYYNGSGLKFEDMRAPEFPDLDILDRTMKATRKHGFKTYALIEEAEGEPPAAPWQAFYEVDFKGRRQRNPCSNNPGYRAFNLGLVEDYTRSYDVDGFMWSSERQGAFTDAIGAKHGGQGSDPGRVTCFCEYCVKKAAAKEINVDRAKQGFAELETFVRAGRANKRPRDGYFVTLFRLMLRYPELLAWEQFWIDSRTELMIDIRNKVKSINPKTPVGFHVWHNASFSPFYRAEIDFGTMAKNADFIKPVVYNACAGTRIKTYVNSVGQTIFGDLAPEQILQMHYDFFGYTHEAPYDKVGATGFSTDYIAGEVKRTLDDVAGTGVPIYAGLDCDIPGSTYTADSVKASVLAAFHAGADGVIFARNWGEMNMDHVPGIGAAVKELGIG